MTTYNSSTTGLSKRIDTQLQNLEQYQDDENVSIKQPLDDLIQYVNDQLGDI